ncbi:MAG: NAD(P)-binding domain-containing protein, partial [Flavobacteriaceae bacterium]|nr:NAD(P)-binding domain-containing protein [Flavobacteriaceae bacterium]
MKIAIIGTGNLGKSMAKGLILNNAITTLYLSCRHTQNIKQFEGYKDVKITSDNRKAVK